MSHRPVPTYLAELNPHPRDPFIEFDEGPHIYTVHGEGGYTSVTTWNHSHFSHFDANKIVSQILASPKMRTDPTYKYYGKTREQILGEWDANRDQASGAGTSMHYDIECYYNQMPVNNDSIEYRFFRQFVVDMARDPSTKYLVPYRTEWMVYYEELKISGSIDMVFEDSRDGTLHIYDWKRCREIKYEDTFGGRTAVTACIRHLPDTNYWHYALQLNTYRAILQTKYDKRVETLYLVCLHPDNPMKSYERIEVPIMDREIDALFDFRRATMSTTGVQPI